MSASMKPFMWRCESSDNPLFTVHARSEELMLAMKAAGMTVTPLYAIDTATHRIVPVEPTEAMLEAALALKYKEVPQEYTSQYAYSGYVYAAMLAAAPGNEGEVGNG